MAEYTYDVFLSYKRGKIQEEWLNETFRPIFEYHLTEAVGRKCNIFVDKVEIAPGVDWPEYLGEALAKSKCLIAILSPTYFGAEWCVREFKAMYFRQQELKKNHKLKSDHSVLVPFMQKGPIDIFLRGIGNIQYLDYSRYNRIGEAFKNSQAYLDMQTQIEDDARKTATMILEVPEWQTDFLNIDWLNGKNLMLEPVTQIQSKPSF